MVPGTPFHKINKIPVAFPANWEKLVIEAKDRLLAEYYPNQSIELSAKRIELLGFSDPENYPLQPKKHSYEFLREIAHLRARTNTFGAVFRIRHAVIFAIHEFFQKKRFI